MISPPFILSCHQEESKKCLSRLEYTPRLIVKIKEPSGESRANKREKKVIYSFVITNSMFETSIEKIYEYEIKLLNLP